MIVGVACSPCYAFAQSNLLKSEFSESSFSIKNLQQDNAQQESAWYLATELGLTTTTGNTDTKALKAKVNGNLAHDRGQLSYVGTYFKKTSEQEIKAQNWKVSIKNNIHFSEHASSFAIIEYGKDKFTSYEAIATFAAGYTHRLINHRLVQWDADIGPGIKWQWHEGQANKQNVVHIGSNLSINLSETSEFTQKLIADIGISDNATDIYRAESTISANVSDSLKMKLSYSLRHDDQPNEGNEKLDTQTSVSLVFIF